VLHDPSEAVNCATVGTTSVWELQVKDLDAISFEHCAIIQTFVESDYSFHIDLQENLKKLHWSLRRILVTDCGTR
jgi:hypothetical protein